MHRKWSTVFQCYLLDVRISCLVCFCFPIRSFYFLYAFQSLGQLHWLRFFSQLNIFRRFKCVRVQYAYKGVGSNIVQCHYDCNIPKVRSGCKLNITVFLVGWHIQRKMFRQSRRSMRYNDLFAFGLIYYWITQKIYLHEFLYQHFAYFHITFMHVHEIWSTVLRV